MLQFYHKIHDVLFLFKVVNNLICSDTLEILLWWQSNRQLLSSSRLSNFRNIVRWCVWMRVVLDVFVIVIIYFILYIHYCTFVLPLLKSLLFKYIVIKILMYILLLFSMILVTNVIVFLFIVGEGGYQSISKLA